MDLGFACIPIRNTKTGRPHPKTKFTSEEDVMLVSLVNKYGMNSWDLIVKSIPGRNQRQCKERYLNYLDPTINNAPWTIEEDTRLIAAVKNIGTRWVKMTSLFNHRTENQLKNRWKLLLRRIEVGSVQNNYCSPSTQNTSCISNPNSNSFVNLETPDYQSSNSREVRSYNSFENFINDELVKYDFNLDYEFTLF